MAGAVVPGACSVDGDAHHDQHHPDGDAEGCREAGRARGRRHLVTTPALQWHVSGSDLGRGAGRSSMSSNSSYIAHQLCAVGEERVQRKSRKKAARNLRLMYQYELL